MIVTKEWLSNQLEYTNKTQLKRGVICFRLPRPIFSFNDCVCLFAVVLSMWYMQKNSIISNKLLIWYRYANPSRICLLTDVTFCHTLSVYVVIFRILPVELFVDLTLITTSSRFDIENRIMNNELVNNFTYIMQIGYIQGFSFISSALLIIPSLVMRYNVLQIEHKSWISFISLIGYVLR